MQAIRVIDGAPTLVDEPAPGDRDDGVRVKIHATSICGSDLHLLDLGFAEGRILGHEFAGVTPDGTAVAVEPIIGCDRCGHCHEGVRHHCDEGAEFLGVMHDGGYAQEIVVPERTLAPLPTGLDVAHGALVEPTAVALRAVNRAGLNDESEVLVIGAGPIGLACVAVLTHRGIGARCSARHDHQRAAVERLGGMVWDPADGGRFPVVIDAAATETSFPTAVRATAPLGRLVLVGTPWQKLAVDVGLCMGEVTVIPSATYGGVGPDREFAAAAGVVAETPALADALITHRFPLDGVAEAFATAADRSSGAIKVTFDPWG